MKMKTIYNEENENISNNTRHERDKFIQTITKVFTMARWFGIPTYGNKLALCWCVIMLILLIMIVATAIWRLCLVMLVDAAKGRLIGRAAGVIFYGNALLSLILGWRAVNTWKKLSINWLRIETEGLLLSPDVTIKRRIIFVSTFVAIGSIVEHALNMMAVTGFDCPPSEYLRRYIISSHGFLVRPNDYTVWVAIPIVVMSNFSTILWNFQDLIIILISMGLASRYHRLNSFVKHVVRYEKRDRNVKKVRTEFYYQLNVWRRIREAYVEQSGLVREISEKLGALLLLSNLNNLYFICLQLYGTIRRINSPLIHRFYNSYSCSWLLLRACGVVLAAADVNIHSARALPYLDSCPDLAYNVEIRRLKDQLKHDRIALSAKGFFTFDRPILLQVAAVIVKYELILLQYDN